MPDMQKQVDSVREAFSADIRKPFVLKPSFPYGSPHSATHPSPPGGVRQQLDHLPHSQQQQVSSYTTTSASTTTGHNPLTPVSSVGGAGGPPDGKGDSPRVVQSLTSLASVHGSQASGVAQNLPLSDPPAWNPSRIFEYVPSPFSKPSPHH